MDLKKLKLCFLELVVLIITFMIIFITNLIYSVAWTNKSYIENESLRGSMRLSSTYDLYGESLNDFYNKEDSLNILNNTYVELINNEKINYQEFAEQHLTFIGDYKGALSLVDGYDESFINQETKGGIITPLKSVQIGQKELENNHLEEYLSEGQTFSKDDYTFSDDTIRVIMGHNYKEIFKLHDKFSAYYLSENKIECEVIGFYKENTNFNLAGNDGVVDDYIVFPLFNLSESQLSEKDFYKFLLLTNKVEGFICYENLRECNVAIDEIKRIANKTGYKYNIEALEFECPNFNENILEYDISLIVSIIGIIVFILFQILLFLLYRKKIINTLEFKSKKECYIYMSKILLIMLFEVVLSYSISAHISIYLFSLLGYSDAGFIYLPYMNSIIALTLIIIVKLIFIKIKKKYKKEED